MPPRPSIPRSFAARADAASTTTSSCGTAVPCASLDPLPVLRLLCGRYGAFLCFLAVLLVAVLYAILNYNLLLAFSDTDHMVLQAKRRPGEVDTIPYSVGGGKHVMRPGRLAAD